MDELAERQRNIVFPDTVRNEGEFYRGLVSRPLRTWVDKLGFFLVALIPLLFAGMVVYLFVADAAHLMATRTGKTLYAASELAMVGGGTLAFLVSLVLAIRHGVNKFNRSQRERHSRALPK
jgi:hypothetical protein